MSTLDQKIQALKEPKQDLDFRNVLWVTRDGRQLPLKEMSDGHLANLQAFLKRRLAKVSACALARQCEAMCHPTRHLFIHASATNFLMFVDKEMNYRRSTKYDTMVHSDSASSVELRSVS